MFHIDLKVIADDYTTVNVTQNFDMAWISFGITHGMLIEVISAMPHAHELVLNLSTWQECYSAFHCRPISPG